MALSGRTVLTTRAVVAPRGLAGHAYWWSVAPFHGVVFRSMLANLRQSAERAPATTR